MLTHSRLCRRCGKPFILKNLAYEKRGGGIYCSISCGTRKLSVNEFFFKEINDEKQAYWLGLLFADGYHNKNSLVLSLKEEDLEHLYLFRSDIESSHKITSCISGHGSKIKRISISSVKICNDLDAIGCTQAKSRTIKYPNIHKNLQQHFIRGVSDGDGCFGLNKNKRVKRAYWKWHIYSLSFQFLDSIKKCLVENGIGATRNNNVVSVCGKNNLSNLYDFLYRNSSRSLKRKKDIFEHAAKLQFNSVPY